MVSFHVVGFIIFIFYYWMILSCYRNICLKVNHVTVIIATFIPINNVLVQFEVLCWQLHSITTDEVGYCIPFKILLVTEQLLLEWISGLILTGPPTELRFIHALRLRRINIRVYLFHNDMDIQYFVYSKNVLIRKINSKKLNQIF